MTGTVAEIPSRTRVVMDFKGAGVLDVIAGSGCLENLTVGDIVEVSGRFNRFTYVRDDGKLCRGMRIFADKMDRK